ncbi:MAG: aldo/keto reductase [Eggerthellaceae bacterium]|nr:aldo/keto reductase [Eggerthellaceae bacterium]
MMATGIKGVSLQGLSVPPIALGTWAWGTGFNGSKMIFGSPVDPQELERVYARAAEAGLTFWDTAEIYGKGSAEKLLGGFSRKHGEAVFSTKFFPMATSRKGSLAATLKKSCKNLGVDGIDVYWIHVPQNVEKWTKELVPLMKSGKIRVAGVSNHSLEQIAEARAILESEGLRLGAVQSHFSLLYRHHEKDGVVAYCRENGLVFFSYMVLEQGALTGRYSKDKPLPGGVRGKRYTPGLLASIEPLMAELSRLAQAHGADIPAVAIAWAIAKGTLPIIGVTKQHHLESPLMALGLELGAGEMQRLDDIADQIDVPVKGFWE